MLSSVEVSHCNISLSAVTAALYPTVLHSCRHLFDSLHWPHCPLSTSLLVSSSLTHTHLQRSLPPHLQTFSCDETQLSLSWQTTQQTPLLLRTDLESQCHRAAASHDGNMAYLTSSETDKISKQDCIKGGQSKIRLSIKAINCCIFSTSVST